MNFFFFAWLFCFISLVACNVVRKPYDYYLLQLTVPSSFCRHNRCKGEVPNHFVIHGNWPNRFDNYRVNFCEAGDDDLSVLKPISDELSVYWPALKGGSDMSFWTYEWKKHGCCANETPTLAGPRNYFNTTLLMVKQLNLDDVVRKLGYAPTSTRQSYSTRKFLEALRAHYDVAPYVRCQKERGNVSVLQNISFCYDKQLNPIDCPQKLQCNNEFLFPTPDQKSDQKSDRKSDQKSEST